MSKEVFVINKVMQTEEFFNKYFPVFLNLLKEFKKETRFNKKVKIALELKKVDLRLAESLNYITLLLYKSLQKNLIDVNLAKNYNKMFADLLGQYRTEKEKVIKKRKSKIFNLNKKERGAEGRKEKEQAQQQEQIKTVSAAALF